MHKIIDILNQKSPKCSLRLVMELKQTEKSNKFCGGDQVLHSHRPKEIFLTCILALFIYMEFTLHRIHILKCTIQ